MSTLKQSSRRNWNCDGSFESINTGSLQRIADACELIAKDRDRLEKDLQFYKQLHDASLRMEERLNRQLSNRKGQITKLKNRVAELEGKSK